MKRIGFGQVEPNHLSAQRNGKIYAQLPAAESLKILENGQFVKYDYAKNEVNLTGDGEWLLVLNEVKLYDDRWRESYKDFAMKASDAFGGKIVPRLFKTDVGDIYTTNCLDSACTAKGEEVDMGEGIVEGAYLNVDATGYLKVGANSGDMVWKVVKVYTMPDGQPGVKLQRIK